MTITAYACALEGIRATIIREEVALASGNCGTTIVALPQRSVKESRLRIFTAMKINDHDVLHKKLVVNLSPADFFPV